MGDIQFSVETNAAAVARAMHMAAADLPAAMYQAGVETGAAARQLLSRTTTTWTARPIFEDVVEATVSGYDVLVGPSGPHADVWRMLDDGTRAHTIAAKNAPALVFVWGGPGSYKAKTRPGVLAAGPGGATGNLVAFRKVRHPGTVARNWTAAVRASVGRRSGEIMIRALQKWSRSYFKA